MKSKILKFVSFMFAMCFLFTGCNNKDEESSNAITVNLSYNVKYIEDDYAHDEELAGKCIYYVFFEDNTGYYYVDYKLDDYDIYSHYKINFKYVVFEEDFIICVYDSHEILERHTGGDISNSFRAYLNVSESLLMNNNMTRTLYFSENYLNESK